MTIVLDDDTPAATGEPGDSARRNGRGQYLVVPPGAKKPKGYGRATGLAKVLDDESNLMRWGARMVAIGLAQRPDLLALVAAASPDDRDELNKLCDRAKEAGGATARRDLGTALHKLVERSHTDPSFVVPPMYREDVHALTEAITAHGFEVVDDLCEVMVVLDELCIAGTADMVLRRISDGRLFIADIKTGSSIDWGALAWAIQLAIYARADARYVQGEAEDGSEDQRLPMPEVDQRRAIILHIEPGSGRCDLHWLDIERGAQALELAVAVREMRNSVKRKGNELLTPLTAPDALVEDLQASVDAIEGGGADTAPGAEVGSVEEPTSTAAPSSSGDGSDTGEAPDPASGSGPSPDPADAILHEARVAWVLRRVEAIREAGHLSTLGPNWPSGIAKPAAVRDGQSQWGSDDLTRIVEVLDAVEAEHDMPFGDTDPADEVERAARAAERAEAAAERMVPRAGAGLEPAPNEGWLPAEQRDELRQRLAALPDHARHHVLGWSRAAANHDSRLAWNMGTTGRVSLRRWSIAAAALELVDLVTFPDDGDDEVLPNEDRVRLALSLVMGDVALQPAFPVGALLGALTIDEADRLATHRLVIEDGTPRLVAAA